MKKEIRLDWSEEEKAEGARRRQAWEQFFSATRTEKEISKPPFPTREEEVRITEIRTRYETKLLRYPNVVGVAEGIRTRQGKPTGEPCVVVYVERKIARTELEPGEILPSDIEGIPVDVVEIGKVEFL